MGTLSLHQIDHFLIIFFTFVLMGLCICSGINHDVVCKEEEKRALLCFKKESKAPMNWVDKADWCSKWEGVVCDNVTGHVIELSLGNLYFGLRLASPPKGDVSHFLCHFQNVSNELKILHLGGNDLSGEIPECWMHWPHLEVINLSKNKLDGTIPDSIGLLNQLRSLDLHKNFLSGHIPLSLQNCTLLLKVDLGENRLTGKIPRWLGARLSNLTILRLRSNKFYGELPHEFCHLTFLRILDLANNKLFGVLPRCLQNLTSMMYKETQGDYGVINYSVFGGAFGDYACSVVNYIY